MTRETSIRDTDTIKEETEGKKVLQRLTKTRDACSRLHTKQKEKEGKSGGRKRITVTMTRHNKQYRTGGKN
jgi:hypothetical protein